MTTPDENPNRKAVAPLPGIRPERHAFSMRFTSSPRGAQLARRLAVKSLDQWGYPPASDTSCTVALLVGELAANAVCHGRVPGRDFLLRLTCDTEARLLRIEVSDANPHRPPAQPTAPDPDDESGRGLLLVDILATRWGSSPRHPIGKTTWSEIAIAAPETP